MISISHSPNSNFSQYLMALSYLLLPWKWGRCKKGKQVEKLEKEFSKYLGVDDAVSFSKGREALLAVIKSLGIGDGDEVIIQGYTCIVVPNSVIYAGATPIYVDVDSSLNLDIKQLEQKISSKTKAVVIQHSFGIPADVKAIKALCDKHGLKLIEDCAHSLSARVGEQLVGTFGDVAIFSFGRDKIISSVSGGMAVAKDGEVLEKIKSIRDKAPIRSYSWIIQNLLHPLTIPWMSRLIDVAKLGQFFIKLSQALHITNKVYTVNEKKAKQDQTMIYQLPNSMAALAHQQIDDLERLHIHRREIAKKYFEFCSKHNLKHQSKPEGVHPAYLRYTLFMSKPDDFRKFAREHGFLLGDWYKNVVMPMPKDPKSIKYEMGSCPEAEKYASQSVNLPTHWKLTRQKAHQLLEILDKEL